MKKITAIALAAPLAVSLAIPATATAVAPSYDNPYDIQVAKRLTIKAFYGVSYGAQRRICNSYDSRMVWTVRRIGKITYRNTPDSVSLREAQKGVILALSQVC